MRLLKEQTVFLTITIGITGTLAVVYMYQSQILIALSVVFWLLALVALLSIIGGAWFVVEKLLLLRVNRVELTKHAHTMIIQNEGQTYIRDTAQNAVYHSLHLQARPTFATGNTLTLAPTPQEMAVFEAFNAPKRSHRQLAMTGQIEIGEDSPIVYNWLDTFSHPLQAYAIIGKQQSGKTRQAQHLAAKWLSEGVKPLVIGPKFDRGEWLGCELVGGKDDTEAVLSGLTRIMDEAKRRHSSELGHKEHPILPIFLDDWSAIILGCGDIAKDLIYKATTTYASVNLILYFINHADTVPAWGVDKVGAALKDGFTKLLITPFHSPDGRIIHSKAKALIVMGGGEERLSEIIQGDVMPPSLVSDSPVLPMADKPELNEGDMSEQDIETMAIYEGGEKRISYIAKEVYGHKGKHYNGKVEATLARYNGHKKP